jgi:hypothetical protein
MKRWVVAVVLAAALQGPATGLSKCCPLGRALGLHSKQCEGSGQEEQEGVINVKSRKNPMDGRNVSLSRLYTEVPVEPWPHCNRSNSYLITRFSLLRRGRQLSLFDLVNKMPHPESAFCLDTAQDPRTGQTQPVAKLCEPCTDPARPCINYCKQGPKDLDWPGPPLAYTRLSVPLHCRANRPFPQHLFNVNNDSVVVDGQERELSEYCIEIEPNKTHTLMLCDKEDTYGQSTLKRTVKIVLFFFSLVSFLILIVLHIIIQDLWKHHFTKLKVPFFFSGAMSFLFSIIGQFVSPRHSLELCIFNGLMIQYWFLAMYLWLTTMSRNIWATFRTLENPLQMPAAREARQRRERRWAFAISFGLPVLIMLVTLAVQTLVAESSSLHPRIVQGSCFIDQFWPKFMYFHLPMLLLLCANLFLYGILVVKFSCGIWSTSPGESEDGLRINWRNLRIVIELFVFMGIYWLSEVSPCSLKHCHDHLSCRVWASLSTGMTRPTGTTRLWNFSNT